MPVWLRWQPPRLHLEEEAREARVTSVDLFYDLIFGAVMAQLALGLARDVTLHGLFLFALLFVAVVRVWSSETFYSDHFETLDVSYRLSVLAAMLCAGGLAVSVPQGFGGLFPVFALSMAAARIVLVVQWLRVRRHEPPARGLARRYVLLYGWVGAIVGGFVFGRFGGPGVTGFNLISILVATVGAMIVLFIAGLFNR